MQEKNSLPYDCKNILPPTMINRMKGSLTSCYEKLVALDIDVSVFDNSDSHKEGIEPTYQKVDGYALLFAYLGEEGYCVGASLRKGSDHSQKDAPAFIQESIRISRRIDPSRELLLRAGSAHDSTDTLKVCLDEQVHKNMIYLAVRLVNRARSAFLKFSKYCRWFTTFFNRVYQTYYAC